MEPIQTNNSKLVEGGRNNFEETEQFRLKVREIEREVNEKYAPILSTESKWLKRFLLKIRVKIETNRRVGQLSSGKNLHAVIDLV